MKLRSFLIGVAVAAAGTALFAGNGGQNISATPRTLTLDAAVQLALKQNPDILKAKQEIERTRGVVIEVRAEALPHIILTNSYTEQSKTLFSDSGGAGNVGSQSSAAQTGGSSETASGSSSGGSAQSGTFASTTGGSAQFSGGSLQNKAWNVTIQAQQVLYSGSVGPAIRIARFAQDSSIYSLRDVIDTVIDNVRKQFYDVLLNRELITVQEESVTLLQNQLKDQQNRFEAGTVPRFNVLQAEVALANAQPNLIRAKNAYLLSQLTLAKTLGLGYNQAHPGRAPFEAIGSLEMHERRINVADAIATAKQRRPFLKVQRQQILIQTENIKVALAGYQPQLNASGGYEVRNSRASKELNDTVQGWFFGVNGTWNIFDGMATYGKTKQARAQFESAKVNYDDSIHQVELEVQQAVDNLQQAKETLESQTKTVEQALEAVRLAQERLNAGAGVQLDVLNAQVQLTQARSTVLQAQHDYLSALADFERVTATATQYDELFDDPLMKRASRSLSMKSQEPGSR
jgi:outer membrane protein TolC